MKLRIITPSGITYEGEVSRVQFPSFDGLTEVLDNHDKMISLVGTGQIVTDQDTFECTEGFIKVEDNNVTIVCS